MMLTGPGVDKGLVFVSADARGRPAARDRKLIRSHVMRGKNTRTRGLPDRSKGPPPATAVESQQRRYAGGGNGFSEESHEAQTRHELLSSDTDAVARIRHSGMNPRAANVFTFVKFPEDINSSSRSLLHTCTSLLLKLERSVPLTPSVFQTFRT